MFGKMLPIIEFFLILSFTIVAFISIYSFIKRTAYLSNILEMLLLGIFLGTGITVFAKYFFSQYPVLYLPLSNLFGYPRIFIRFSEIIISISLFLLCYFRLEFVSGSRKLEVTNWKNEFVYCLFFSLSYSTTYAFVEYYVEKIAISFVGVTFVGLTFVGLAGGILPNNHLRAHGLLTKITSALGNTSKKDWAFLGYSALCITALVFSIVLQITDREVNYQVSYQSQGSTLTKSVTTDNDLGLSIYFQSRKELSKALVYAEKHLSYFPKDLKGHLKKAELLADTSQYQAAIEELKRTIKLDPSLTEAHYGLILAYEALGLYAEAIDSVNTLLALAPVDKANLLFIRTSLLLRMGEFQLAAADADHIPSGYGNALLLKSVALLGQGEVEAARVAFDQNLEAAPFSIPVTTTLLSAPSISTVLLNASPNAGATTGTPPPVINALAFVSSSAPSPSFLTKATTLFISGDHLTQTLQTMFITGSEGSLIRQKILVTLLNSQGLKKEALDAVDRAIEIASSGHDRTMEIGLLSEAIKISRSGDQATLERYYSRYLELTDNQPLYQDDIPAIYYALGLNRFKEGKISEAIRDFSEAIRHKPDYKEAYLARAQAYAKLGEYDKSVNDVEEGLDIDPSWMDAKIHLGHYLGMQGRFDEAEEIFKAIESQPIQNPLYLHYRGYFYILRGERDSSIAKYDECFQLLSSFAVPQPADIYQLIADDLTVLMTMEPDKTPMIGDVFLMMRTSMPTTYQPFQAYSQQPAIPNTAAGATVTATAKTFWLLLSVVGPQKIRPGSSDVIEILAELKTAPSYSGTAFPLQIIDDQHYTIHVNLQAVNFEVNESKTAYELKLNEPIQWQFVVAPKPGHEGEQRIAYEIVVENKDQSLDNLPKSSPLGTITIHVPTKYGIPPNLLYPISGVLAGIATISALPIWNYLKPYLESQKFNRKRKSNKE